MLVMKVELICVFRLSVLLNDERILDHFVCEVKSDERIEDIYWMQPRKGERI